jgi:hypothetical protein
MAEELFEQFYLEVGQANPSLDTDQLNAVVGSILETYGGKFGKNTSPFTVDPDGTATTRKLNQLQRFTRGETIGERDAVAIAANSTQTIRTLTVESTHGTSYHIGGTIQEKVAQSITGTGLDYNKVVAYLTKGGAPSGSIVCSIQTNASGAPSGTVLATGSLAVGAISSGADNTFTMNKTVTLANGVVYWLVLEPTAGLDNSNVVDLNIRATGTYAGGECLVYNDGAWGEGDFPDSDARIAIILQTVAGQAFRADSDVAALTDGYVGQAYSPDDGTNIDVLISGIQSGYAGLTIGATYYVNATPGSIGTSAGTTTKKVGIAIASDQLYILPTI